MGARRKRSATGHRNRSAAHHLKKGYWTHVVDANGKIIYHFPSTLGAGYDPFPSGDFKVTDVSREPAFHYQPKLFAEVPVPSRTRGFRPVRILQWG